MNAAFLFTALMITTIFVNSCRRRDSQSRVKLDSGETLEAPTVVNKAAGTFYTKSYDLESEVPPKADRPAAPQQPNPSRIKAPEDLNIPISPSDAVTVASRGSNYKACTGTAVSTTTVVTAAHCVFLLGNDINGYSSSTYDAGTGAVLDKEFCVKIDGGQDVCSRIVYINLAYPIRGKTSGTADSAYVVFPQGTFKHFFNFYTGDKLKISDRVLLVGYSDQDLEYERRKNGGLKRFGYNKIDKFEAENQDDMITLYGSAFDAVALSPGDSGGPMFKDCQVVGVASRSTIDAKPKFGIHTNLTYRDQVQFFKTAKAADAYFCGLSGNDPHYCPREGLMHSNPKAKDKEFPCASTIE